MISVLRSLVRVGLLLRCGKLFIFEIFLVGNGFTLAYVLSVGALMIDKHSEFIISYLDCLCFSAYNPGQQLVSFPKCSSLL